MADCIAVQHIIRIHGEDVEEEERSVEVEGYAREKRLERLELVSGSDILDFSDLCVILDLMT